MAFILANFAISALAHLEISMTHATERTSYETLSSAKAHVYAGNGWVYRTDTALFALASFDAANLIEEVSQRQRQPQMLDHLLTAIRARPVDGFGLIFAAGGRLHVMLVGGASLEVSSTRANVRLVPQTAAPLIWPIPEPPQADRVRWQLKMSLDTQIQEFRDPSALTDLDLEESLNQAYQVVIDLGASSHTTQSPNAPVLASLSQQVKQESAVKPKDLTEPAPTPTPAPPTTPTPTPAPSPAPPTTPAASTATASAASTATASAADTITFADDLLRASTMSQPLNVDVQTHISADTQFGGALDIARQTTVENRPETTAVTTSLPTDFSGETATVLGITCTMGHHNNPAATLCSSCGSDLQNQQVLAYVNGPRPDLGRVLLDDGTSYALNRPIIFGREVDSHSDVINGSALGVIVTDDSLSISRQHVRVVLEDWDVLVQDLASSNGTWLQRSGHNDWERVTEAKRPLAHGDKVRIGNRTLHFLLK